MTKLEIFLIAIVAILLITNIGENIQHKQEMKQARLNVPYFKNSLNHCVQWDWDKQL
jgi:hypothetical protein